MFRREKLAQTLSAALTAAYTAFRPLVEDNYPANPFAGFGATFGFLDTAPTTTSQVRFLPYYYDFFDDLLAAYEEFRWKGAELLCACCPPSELFPRHLMLGAVQPASVPNAALYRQSFLSSAALSGCEQQSQEVSGLFQRLVEMVAQFTINPPLPKAAISSRVDGHIRMTPSHLGSGPISDKAIPYYYQQTGTPPLYQVWSPQKTRRGRANQNLSYRADEYAPAPPTFVLQPLRYDLEPHNFLRVEGHLGKNYQSVLTTLLGLKTRHRLPIDIVALRTGAFDATMPVDLSDADCQFQDLETLYDTLRAELTCFLCKQTQYFYDLPFERRTKITEPAKPKLPLLTQCAPDFLVQPQTLGRFFEDWYSNLPAGALPELDPSVIINFLNTQNVGQSNAIIFYLLVYITKFYEQLTPDLRQLDFARLEKRHQDLASVTEAIEREREGAMANLEGNAALLRWEELDDRLEDILYNCRLEAFRALLSEYQRRLTELKQKQFLSYFLRQHPGIQHKAGVPLGGTFIVVYHDDPDQRRPGLGLRRFDLTNLPATAFTRAVTSLAETGRLNSQAVSEALGRISVNKELVVDEDVRFILGTLTGMVPNLSAVAPPAPQNEAEKVIAAAVNELADGTVIADFFLPYLCCSDCAPVQFVLPKAPPSFTVQMGCTNPNNEAEVQVTPEGGLPPYSLKLDTQEYRPLSGAVLVSAGSHTLILRDAEAVESAPQPVVIAPQLRLLEPVFDCVGDNNEYVVSLQISGGTPPYTANRGTVDGPAYLSDALPGDTETEIIITDSRHCTATQRVQHSCRQALAFTIQLGCTTANNGAAVEITPSGGTAPYQVQVNDGEFAPLHGPVTLPVGAHRLVLQDAASTTTEAQRIEIAPQLLLQETDFTCEGSAAYRSFIRIAGGTPPYLFKGAPVTGDTLVTEPIASGTSAVIEVEDQRGCKASVEVKHSCEQPCELPCDGQSRRGAYRLWLQSPVEGAPYEAYRQDGEVKFRFNDKDFALEGAATLVQIPNGQLNGNFRNAIGGAIKKLNERIQQALVAEFGAELGANRLVLSYEPAATDPFGILWIEHFVCERFSLELPFSVAKPTPTFSLLMRYTNEPDATGAPFNGAILLNRRLNNQESRVPAFDNQERNQCTGSEYQKLCEGPNPKPAISIDRQANNGFVFTGNVENVPQESITAWVWDASIAQPTEPFYQGQKVEAQLQKPGGAVRLTAITDKGCVGQVEQPIP
nr:SprB repeat-containing protein [Hymenobacter sp. HDW8]